MSNKITSYLRDREDQEITVQEMIEAGLGTEKTLLSYLSRLIRDPVSGISRVGNDHRQNGVIRSYKYNALPEDEHHMLSFRRIGSTIDNNDLVIDDRGNVFEVKPLGSLNASLYRFIEIKSKLAMLQ
jgi:hypothetical protein